MCCTFRDEDIDSTIEILINNNYDSVISYVNTGEKHPLRLKRIRKILLQTFVKNIKNQKKVREDKILSLAILEMVRFML